MSSAPTACLVIIGNEILSGRTLDANLPYLAKKLGEIGIRLREARVVPDIEAEIVAAIHAVRMRYDYVFTTGGIGPTHDDITTASIAAAFGVPVVRHPVAEALLRNHYTADQINAARLKMADVPEGAELLNNPVTSAPGFRIANVYVMAGVPRIMQGMLDDILPTLRSSTPIRSVSVTTNLTEGVIAQGLTEIQARFPEIDVGSYPMYERGQLATSLVLRSADDVRNRAAAAEVEAMIAACGGDVLERIE